MMPGLPFSSKLRRGSYSVPFAKAAVVSINLLYDPVWKTVFITRLLLLVAT